MRESFNGPNWEMLYCKSERKFFSANQISLIFMRFVLYFQKQMGCSPSGQGNLRPANCNSVPNKNLRPLVKPERPNKILTCPNKTFKNTKKHLILNLLLLY